jgi:peptide/nickel transport system ATP-binding protein
MSQPLPLLELDGVAKTYRMRRGPLSRPAAVHAVDGLSLTLGHGQTLGVVGESGCGKSTLGRIALGLEQPDRGQVRFDGNAMPSPGSAAWRRLRARMQLVFQDPLGAMDRRLPIATQIAEPLQIHRIGSPAERADRVERLLRSVGLGSEHAGRYPHELSGGQRQRAVLARALATDPALLVADEPVSALDVSIQAQVVNMLNDLQQARGIAMLFISHDLKVIRQVSQRVAVMYLGRIVEQGDVDEIFADPIHPYSQALVSAVPEPGPRRRPRIVLSGEPPNPADRPAGCAFHPRCPVAIADCRVVTPTLQPVPGRGAATGPDGRPGGRKVACLRAAISPTSVRIAA